jgi:hypothetical protein
MSRDRTIVQWFCLAFGAALILRGTIGVAVDPEFGTPGEGWHQLFHLVSGVVLVACWTRAGAALTATLGFAAVYAIVMVAGLVDGSDVFGLIPIEASDNRVHVTFTAGSLAFGIAGLLRRPREIRPAT